MASSPKSNTLFSNQLNPEDDPEIKKNNYVFLKNWVTDLMNAMYDEPDEESGMKLFESCGKGCYNRHQFKQDIAAKGKDNLENLIKAYGQNFEIRKEG